MPPRGAERQEVRHGPSGSEAAPWTASTVRAAPAPAGVPSTCPAPLDLGGGRTSVLTPHEPVVPTAGGRHPRSVASALPTPAPGQSDVGSVVAAPDTSLGVSADGVGHEALPGQSERLGSCVLGQGRQRRDAAFQPNSMTSAPTDPSASTVASSGRATVVARGSERGGPRRPARRSGSADGRCSERVTAISRDGGSAPVAEGACG